MPQLVRVCVQRTIHSEDGVCVSEDSEAIAVAIARLGLRQALIRFPASFLRLLLPYERHLKGEQDKPLPLPKPRKQDGVPDKAPSAKVKAAGAKKLKSANPSKSETKNDRGEAAKEQEQSQVSGASCPWLPLTPASIKSQFAFCSNVSA